MDIIELSSLYESFSRHEKRIKANMPPKANVTWVNKRDTTELHHSVDKIIKIKIKRFSFVSDFLLMKIDKYAM